MPRIFDNIEQRLRPALAETMRVAHRADEELRAASALSPDRPELDNQTALRLKKGLAEEFREQLTFGAPTNQDEAGLRKLAWQIRAGKVVVRLHLLFRSDLISPTVAYLGSSNLTQSGLSLQGELNVDVLDQDACQKLAGWFEDRSGRDDEAWRFDEEEDGLHRDDGRIVSGSAAHW